MKIIMREPDGPYQAEVDPGVMEVEIREAFVGLGLVSPDGQRLSVCMRDGGFEVRHNGGEWVEFK